ncbi:uncharacterized protein LOC119668147 [Teleopsis dalmanni]|uniref:uncharacterized protein LOC119668147 n=1 Tax=Teleopsis dalmanni TaxID=139649 RepID=UPI0018CDF710|nr:uncharacterized protein LOC119668147 [Teleopsis dalmanni]
MRNHIAKFFVLVIVTVALAKDFYDDIYSIIDDDLEIGVEFTNYKCNKMHCPLGTDHCQLEKYTDTENPSNLIRNTTCFSKTGSILKSNIESSKNKKHTRKST